MQSTFLSVLVTDFKATGHLTTVRDGSLTLLGHSVTDAAATTKMCWSFDAVYEAYFEFVRLNLRRMGVFGPALDDAVQDVFVVVYRKIADFEGRSSVKTWVTGIVLRVASDYRRRYKRRDACLDNLSDNHPRADGDPCQSAIHAQSIRQLDAILKTMDPRLRDAFVLAEMEELSAPEIAEAIGVNVNTVYSRLRKARRVFEAALVVRQRMHR